MAKLFKLYEYGKSANSYDMLKFIALATMIIDHIGRYFLPDMLWLRVGGRIALPCFAFLVGYSQNYRFDRYLLIGAAIASAVTAMLFLPVFPLNILWSILLWRLIMAKLEKTKSIHHEIWMIWFICALFYLPLTLITEYGTIGVMFAVLGWHTRQKNPPKSLPMYWATALLFWGTTQQIVFGFSTVMALAFCAEMLVLFAWLQRFDMHNIRLLPMNTLILALARNTLVIYVLHLAIFQLIHTHYHPDQASDRLVLFKLTEYTSFP